MALDYLREVPVEDLRVAEPDEVEVVSAFRFVVAAGERPVGNL